MNDIRTKNIEKLLKYKIFRMNGGSNKKYSYDYMCGKCGKGFNMGQKHVCTNKKTSP